MKFCLNIDLVKLMKKIKLLLCLEELQLNGVRTSFLEFLKVIDREKFEVYLFAYTHGGPYWNEVYAYGDKVLPEIPDYKIAREYSFKALKYAFMHGFWRLGFKRFVYPILGRIGCRVNTSTLILNAPQIPGEYDIAIGYVPTTLFYIIQYKVNARKRIIWQHSDYRFDTSEWKFAHFDKLDALVCVGKGIENLLRHDYPELEGKLFTVHNILNVLNIVEKSKGELLYPKEDGVFRLVTVGRFSPQKTQLIIPSIAAIIKKLGYKFEWLLIGDDTDHYGKKVHKLCEKENLLNEIKFLGKQNNPHPIVKSADLVVVPSTFEGWGLVVTEAIALGVPTLVSDIPVFYEQCSTDDIIPLDAKMFAYAIAKRFDRLLAGEKLFVNFECLNLVTFENVKSEFEYILQKINVL